eukprot:scaffold8166_cov92-Skeletonema_menzelii.AAC.2
MIERGPCIRSVCSQLRPSDLGCGPFVIKMRGQRKELEMTSQMDDLSEVRPNRSPKRRRFVGQLQMLWLKFDERAS